METGRQQWHKFSLDSAGENLLNTCLKGESKNITLKYATNAHDAFLLCRQRKSITTIVKNTNSDVMTKSCYVVNANFKTDLYAIYVKVHVFALPLIYYGRITIKQLYKT